MTTKNTSYNLEFLDRFTMMLTDEQIRRLSSFRVLLFGVGGVGSAVAHMLVRSGIHDLRIVDFDDIDVTNINRQMVANSKNVGKLKVDELEIQLKDINPCTKITKYPLKLDENTINEINFDCDYIIDCIDDIKAKKLLILKANEKNIPLLSSMGAGNRMEIPEFKIADIQKTSYDPIAKILRKFCKEQGIKHLKVCFTTQKALKFDCKTIASVVYYPINMATIITAEVINDIIN
ncbi:MAG: tRNA threonylcarbamoyladenosine dehydratase [Clostridiales bacterium]|nr:tRNA threonylcarbamoyladenosine dehydratase [Clostridiales bacterium]